MGKIIEYMHINDAVVRRVYYVDYIKSLKYFRALDCMKKEGLCREIKVSNYTRNYDNVCCLVNVYR